MALKEGDRTARLVDLARERAGIEQAVYLFPKVGKEKDGKLKEYFYVKVSSTDEKGAKWLAFICNRVVHRMVKEMRGWHTRRTGYWERQNQVAEGAVGQATSLLVGCVGGAGGGAGGGGCGGATPEWREDKSKSATSASGEGIPEWRVVRPSHEDEELLSTITFTTPFQEGDKEKSDVIFTREQEEMLRWKPEDEARLEKIAGRFSCAEMRAAEMRAYSRAIVALVEEGMARVDVMENIVENMSWGDLLVCETEEEMYNLYYTMGSV